MSPALGPRSGLQLMPGGIFYWYFDALNVANYFGPIDFLERLSTGGFILQTTAGQRLRIPLAAAQVAEFRSLGGKLKSDSESPLKEPAKTRSGIQKTAQGLYFWFQGSDSKITHIGPITDLELMEEGKYAIVTCDATYVHWLDSEDIANFQRFGGTVTRKSKPPMPETKDKEVSSTTTIENEGNSVCDGPKTPAKEQYLQHRTLLWFGANRPVTFGPYRLKVPLVFISSGRPPVNEASCIDIRLPIGKPVNQPRGALGYWPSFDRISPDQRANYLGWLASDRDSNLDDIGYAFLFFYGLERRVLLDNDDIDPVVREIVRLLHRYTFSGSFTGYLSHLLAYVIARTGIEKIKQGWFDRVFAKKSLEPSEEIVAFALAWHLKQNRPLSLGWAMRIAREHAQSPSSAVVQRVPEQFEALFAQKYRSRFGDGFVVQAAAQDRQLDYKQPASPSLLGLGNRNSWFARAIHIPNVLGLQSQFLPLVKIWEECIDELKPLSRQLAKGAEENSRTVWEVLPDDLKAQTEHPDTPQWNAVVAEHASEDGYVIVPLCKLTQLLGFEERRLFTSRQCESLAQTAEGVGYCIEPDFRMTGRRYSCEDMVALFRNESESTPTTYNRYLSAALILELGLAVAAADGVISEEDVTRIGRFLESQFVLDQCEVKRLKQLERVYLTYHPVLSRVSKRLLKSLSQSQREQVARFLFGVAAADGSINAVTLKALRRAYRAIAVNLAQLDGLLQELRTTRPIQGADDGVAYQDPHLQSVPSETRLDQDRIRQIMAETQALGEILGQVFAEDEACRSRPGTLPLSRSELNWGSVAVRVRVAILS